MLLSNKNHEPIDIEDDKDEVEEDKEEEEEDVNQDNIEKENDDDEGQGNASSWDYDSTECGDGDNVEVYDDENSANQGTIPVYTTTDGQVVENLADVKDIDDLVDVSTPISVI
ncbi:hypothetical protein L1987_39704 [Smallanthus sonchifolius]|uniref:Uncharacterized protein n=1 Tax=Smallanthus sonchifolius TaxID=185202 RepID=A0ACB9HPH5_9ASTR|nr:hypothetical protein L1987_39704 [Smallanthus sonchifolius]